MEKAQVILIEDHSRISQLATQELERHGHTVAATLATRKEALAHIDEAFQNGVVYDAAIVDGNLGEGAPFNEDADIICTSIKARGAARLVIGFSAGDLAEGICDLNAKGKSMNAVLEYLKLLEEREA